VRRRALSSSTNMPVDLSAGNRQNQTSPASPISARRLHSRLLPRSLRNAPPSRDRQINAGGFRSAVRIEHPHESSLESSRRRPSGCIDCHARDFRSQIWNALIKSNAIGSRNELYKCLACMALAQQGKAVDEKLLDNYGNRGRRRLERNLDCHSYRFQNYLFRRPTV
jgi:hypothetical protein